MKHNLWFLMLVASCAVQKPQQRPPRSEADFVYVYNHQYWTKQRYIDSFGHKPSEDSLLRNNPNFRLWEK
jgi:hypothetical protein